MLYAIEAVLDIAYHAGGEAVQSREITRRQGIPGRYLEQALQNLVRQGILVGVRGPRGGYRLARERRRISIGDIARVVHELEAGNDVFQNAPESALGQQVVRPMWIDLHNAVMERLNGITIDDLCKRANAAGVAGEGRPNLDFSI